MIILKSKQEIEIMAESGKILAEIMKELESKVKPGIKTKDLDKIAHELILNAGAKPSFLGYDGFPATLCTSLNEEVVHGVPSERILKEGDILSLDLGVLWKGYHSDMAVTLPIGVVDYEVLRLIRVTKKSLKLAVNRIRPGITFGDLGNTIQRYIESQGFGVIRDLCGHGIGRELHEDPQIFNYGKRKTGPEIKEGMVICVEPMVTMGKKTNLKKMDKWGYKMADDSLSCHFEHTIAITEQRCIVLTKI